MATPPKSRACHPPVDIDGGIPGDRGRIRGNREEGEGSLTIGGQTGLILLRRQSSDEESRGTIA
jgi:hypothetical protein